MTKKNKKKQQTEILMNKPFYWGISILELSKILTYELLAWLYKSKI